MIAIDLSKQQALHADPKANQFCCKSRLRWKHSNVFHYWRTKETILDFSQGTVKILQFYSVLN